MKPQSILVTFDGSPCAEAAIDDLRRSGLPKHLEVTMLSVAETSDVESDGPGGVHTAASGTANVALAPLTQRAADDLRHAERVAVAGVQRIRGQHRRWVVHSSVLAGSPGDEILRFIEDQPFDLIVLGSHGRGALGRTILGSVSQRVLAHSPVSVRIGRNLHPFDNEAVRVVLGYDGSPDARVALRAIAARKWPRGSSVRVIGAVNLNVTAYPTDAVAFDFAMQEVFEQQHRRLRADLSNAVKRLKEAGIPATAEVFYGGAASIILDAARSWGADLIAVGAQGHGVVERLVLGSVSSALAARADCSVEVFRRPPDEA